MGEGGYAEVHTPARCDGCGRSANQAGMDDEGWVVSPLSATLPGNFCLSCASALRMLDWFVRCVDCGAIVETEAAAEHAGWRFFPDELAQLQPHCALCSSAARPDHCS